MFTGKVVGSVIATVKDEALKGVKLMVVLTPGNGKDDRLIVAADVIGVAGSGDFVYLVGSREAGIAFGKGRIPVDAGIVGIVDVNSSQLPEMPA